MLAYQSFISSSLVCLLTVFLLYPCRVWVVCLYINTVYFHTPLRLSSLYWVYFQFHVIYLNTLNILYKCLTVSEDLMNLLVLSGVEWGGGTTTLASFVPVSVCTLVLHWPCIGGELGWVSRTVQFGNTGTSNCFLVSQRFPMRFCCNSNLKPTYQTNVYCSLWCSLPTGFTAQRVQEWSLCREVFITNNYTQLWIRQKKSFCKNAEGNSHSAINSPSFLDYVLDLFLCSETFSVGKPKILQNKGRFVQFSSSDRHFRYMLTDLITFNFNKR